MYKMDMEITGIPSYLKWIKPASVLVSGLVTILILIVFWNWLSPVTFWQKVAGFVLSLAGGVVIFISILVLIMMAISVIVSRYLWRKFSHGFKVDDDESMFQ